MNVVETIKERRSTRAFQPDSISEETIEEILKLTINAPSANNLQPWEFVVVKKAELRKKIVEYIGEYWRQGQTMETARESWQGKPWKLKGVVDSGMDYTTAPVYIILFGDTRTQDGLPMGLRYATDRLNLVFNGGLSSTFLYMHLAATTLGLASQWVSAISTPYAHCMVKDLLGLPKALVPYDMLALGYPAINPSDKFMRDPKKMVHYDDCGIDDFRTDEEVRDFVKRARSWTIGTHRRKAD